MWSPLNTKHRIIDTDIHTSVSSFSSLIPGGSISMAQSINDDEAEGDTTITSGWWMTGSPV